ncbi:SpaA isopeptide-forming pilin-related protein [Bifidobacterium sp. ESL0682]|uniref:SpaA isopeptide-forming pilin-related protein n=1 Tax=Bifidobacterium sp. ESL0682 TaxID=2983212 RepID=UPI0023F63394|nr:SpaA isopeptide-forming pilin-related protein [Bifidobacterium sp. ESL0682]WEV41962.1 SpaA isopeptide-forming pilin-related protein [Bifidobacterium sp. ESL0682]
MKLGKGLRGAAAMVLSAATLLALGVTGVGSANAADHDQTIGANDGQITITGGKGHTFEVSRLATYTNVAADGDTATSNITGIAVTTDNATRVVQAVTYANGGVPTDAAWDSANPMNWVAQNWLGYTGTDSTSSSDTANLGDPDNTTAKKPYSGKLRNFVTDLTTAATTITYASATQSDSAAPATDRIITGLTEGIYVVKDTTATGNRAIPMLVGTTAGSNQLTNSSTKTNMVGKIELKQKDVTVSKAVTKLNTNPSDPGTATISSPTEAQWKSAPLNSMFGFRITAKVPMTTGFKNGYTFKVKDTPTAGFTLQDSPAPFAAPVVKIDNNGTVSTLTAGTDYTYTAPSGSDLSFTYDFSNSVLKWSYDSTITIDYTMKLSATGDQSNKATVIHSVDPSNPSTTTETTPNVDPTDPTHNSEIVLSTYTINLTNVLKGTSTGLPGAQFTVKNGSADLKFTQDGSTYTYDPSGTVTSVTTGADGKLVVAGLSQGTFTFTQTTVGTHNPSISEAVKPTFKIEIAPGTTSGTTPGTKFTLTQDVWHLTTVTDGTGSPTPSTTVKDSTDKNVAIQVLSVTSLASLPLTGGAGIILLVALVVLCAAIVVVTSVARRRNMASARK